MASLNSTVIPSPVPFEKDQINENNNHLDTIENSPLEKILPQVISETPIPPLGSKCDPIKRKLPTSVPDAFEPRAKKPSKPPNKKFIYGNYDRYYGYRVPKDSHDIRLDVFREHADLLFHGADILDIGCNTGLVTLAVSRDLGTKSAVGIDIDMSLIRQARGKLSAERQLLSKSNNNGLPITNSYPLHVKFIQGNYVLSDAALLDLEQCQFDTILCLSTSKWIHLNFGDAGLQLAFRRMFRQLRPGGLLVLEAQDWKGYKKRKRLSEAISAHFAAIRMHPQHFKAYLLGSEVGFERSYTLAASSEHVAKGFRRPLQVFVKAGERRLMGERASSEPTR